MTVPHAPLSASERLGWPPAAPKCIRTRAVSAGASTQRTSGRAHGRPPFLGGSLSAVPYPVPVCCQHHSFPVGRNFKYART